MYLPLHRLFRRAPLQSTLQRSPRADIGRHSTCRSRACCRQGANRATIAQFPLIEASLAAPSHALAAFRHRDYRWLWCGTFFSTAAQWIQQATLGWVVYELTESPALLGAVLGVRAIPMLLLAPVSGLVADRFDRRRALALSQIAPAGVSIILAALLARNAVEIWHLFAFSLIGSSGTVFERTLRNTLVFDVVPRAEAANAVALNTIAFSVTRTLGPAVAGILIATVGPAWNFAIQGATYAGVAASAMMVRVAPRRAARHGASAWRSMFVGLRFAATHPVVRVIVIVGLVPPLLLIPSFSALMPVFAADVFRTGPEGLGLLLSAVGAGGIVGGGIAAALSRHDRVGSMQSVSLLAFAACLIGFALSPSMAVALVFLVGAGVFEMVLASSTHTSLQMSAPEAMRGQVTSLLPMFPAFISVGSFAAGVGAQLVGPSALVIGFAVLATLVIGLAWSQSKAFRDLRMSKLVAGG
ncbi:MAG: MFS transporter [Betaproteobacteria bacterium]|nr:MAG: MFS transporter [Betaproteobacteria bacterium]